MKSVVLALRVPPSEVEQLDTLVAKVADRAGIQGIPYGNRGHIAREALRRGLQSIEAEIDSPKKGRK